jgi:hypothetical protein
MAGLPADSLYRETVKRSLLAEICELWNRSLASTQNQASAVPENRSNWSQAA